MNEVITIGVDLAKNVFQVHGVDAEGSVTEPMLKARAAVRAEFDRLHCMVLEVVREDPLCRRRMTIPGVGPITALAFKTAVDITATLRPATLRRVEDRGRPFRVHRAQVQFRGARR